MERFLYLTIAVCALGVLFSLPAGAVFEHTDCCNCESLKPENVPDGAIPQTMPSPFKIVVREETYSPGQIIHVSLIGNGVDTFRSFILVAYKHASWNERRRQAKGQFTLLTKEYQTERTCNNGPSYGLVGKEKMGVNKLDFEWKAETYYGHIEFRATFVQNDQTFWVREKSNILYDSIEGIPPPFQKDYTTPINTDQCGKTKGCYREPEGCVEPQCRYILTWTLDATKINFELGGLTRGASNSYVAAALSDDTDVGDDTVFVCAHNLEHKTTEVYIGNLDDYETTIVDKYEIVVVDDEVKRGDNKYKAVITKEEGSFKHNRLQCRFTVNKNIRQLDKSLRSIGKDSYHLLMYFGRAEDGQPRPLGSGHDEFPHASADKIKFKDYSDSHGRARYPLVKAHGCLMIIAWVLFSSVGFLLAKYYQPMWPEQRFYERKYWFTGHFNCMVMVFILVIISIILIFTEAGGYSKVNDLPYEAHPILGIIILICVLLLPIIGLLRPGPGHRCRPVSNWLYWIFATIANVLAIPNIFIGMDFGKSMVPWWATWILVIWVIFHIIVEITLEVHQCMTHKKNKERRKKHELLKKDYPKQHHPKPELAGRRFKSFMLSLHLAITILIVLIMVIIIAVS